MAKLILNIDNAEDDFFNGVRLLGIMSPLKNYRFCWMVNYQLHYNFLLNTEAEIQLIKKKRSYFFEVYQYFEEVSKMKHYIYCNQFEGEYLLPEFKHIDFLWLIKSEIINENDYITLQQNLKSITGIQLVIELAQEKIKNKENLIL